MTKRNYKTAEDLADLIEKYPNCIITIDNDYWDITETEDSEKYLATSNEYVFDTEFYSDSNNYGNGISEAFKILLNRKGFNITAKAC